jgi:GNAT superfamily N-acetyltransferase
VKGQHLFVRPIESGDDDAVREFLARFSDGDDVPACGLIGKLVGELVAVAAIDFTGDAVRIDRLLVAPELRRKRIGRVMLSELETLAAKMDRRWLVVENAGAAREFLSRVGFVEEGDRMQRRVKQ